MTKQERIEKVVNAITEDFKETIKNDSYYWDIENYTEMIRTFGYDKESLHEDVEYIVINDNHLEDLFEDDELTIAGDSYDDGIKYKDYMKQVRKEMNAWFKERNK